MSYLFRDPFFDALEDAFMSYDRPSRYGIKNGEEETALSNGVNRHEISPLSGFGRMDMHEDKNEYVVKVDVPGVNKEDIKLSIEDGILVIEGERKEEKSVENKEKEVRFNERHFGSFCRELNIPNNVIEDKINAGYENGVLKIILPKNKEEEKSNKKMISVN